jgi:NADH-quinone oxidoreductase subunit C
LNGLHKLILVTPALPDDTVIKGVEMEDYKNTVQSLAEQYKFEVKEFKGDISLLVKPEKIEDVCRVLRDELGFERLSGITGVDYWPEQTPRMHVVYQLHSIQHNRRLELRVPVDGNKPSVPTIEGVYPSANWHEREVWDMFGVRFEGHSDLRRILMPADWEGHPLQKNYPLGYEEVQFSFNAEEISLKKPSPKE